MAPRGAGGRPGRAGPGSREERGGARRERRAGPGARRRRALALVCRLGHGVVLGPCDAGRRGDGRSRGNLRPRADQRSHSGRCHGGAASLTRDPSGAASNACRGAGAHDPDRFIEVRVSAGNTLARPGTCRAAPSSSPRPPRGLASKAARRRSSGRTARGGRMMSAALTSPPRFSSFASATQHEVDCGRHAPRQGRPTAGAAGPAVSS